MKIIVGCSAMVAIAAAIGIGFWYNSSGVLQFEAV